MIDVEKAKKAMASGLAATCAWCEHFWEWTDRQKNTSGCMKEGCGGPSVHMAFPKYKGPWSPREKYCFLCGKEADAVADIDGNGMIGVCEHHISKLKMILKSGGRPVVVKEEEKVPLFDYVDRKGE